MAVLAALLIAAALALFGSTAKVTPIPPDTSDSKTTPRPQSLDNAWLSEVSARIRDASYAFVRKGDAWTAEVPGRGLSGRFDADGARLSLSGDSFHVAVVGIGRDALHPWVPGAPTPGACMENRVAPSGECVRRLEYIGMGLTEWWATEDDGFEQGWAVDTSPDGDGVLTLQLAVDGAEVDVGEGELWLQGDAGALMIVSDLEAKDADGVALHAWFERTDAGFRMRIMDAKARYPIQIDPVYTTAAWAAYGYSGDGILGLSVSGAGDVNGDGYDDVIVGGPLYLSDLGLVYVYLGSASGLSSTAAATLTGEADGDEFGFSVSGAGDVNGDGFDDVIVGAPSYDADTGRAYVYLGSASGVSSTAATTWTGESTNDRFGISLSDAGDVNGDGYADLIVGADRASSTGRAYLYTGSASGLSSTPATTLTGEGNPVQFGYTVSDAGDVNGDGYDDVIVGANGDGMEIGRAYVYLGSASGLSITPATTLIGERRADWFGISVSGAGDINGDGYDDVIVGSPGWDGDGTESGCAYVYSGSASGVSDAATVTLPGGSAYDVLGYSVSGAGDVNGDGYDDLIAGAPGYGGIGAAGGAAYAWLGKGRPDVDGDGYTTSTDCDDTNAAINPAATEVCNDVDDDCDGTVDQGAADAQTWYADADGDGFADMDIAVSACDAPENYTPATEDDCDDLDPTVYPGATEIPGDGIDQDCDGADLSGGDTGETVDSGDAQDTDGADESTPREETGTPKNTVCGCATGSGASASGWVGALVALGLLRRRRPVRL